MSYLNPQAPRTHILRLLGLKTILYKALGHVGPHLKGLRMVMLQLSGFYVNAYGSKSRNSAQCLGLGFTALGLPLTEAATAEALAVQWG